MWRFELKSFTRRGDTSEKINKKKSLLESKRSKKPKAYSVKDNYFLQAKKDWYRARSAYKLIEIDDIFDLIKDNTKICDIWAAPGSFLQVIRKKIWDKWIIVWIDLQEIEKFNYENIFTLKHDIFDFESLKPRVDEIIAEWELFDLITSDIAPNTTGRKEVDQYASVELNIEILKFSDVFLKKWANLILKIFKWEDFHDLTNQIWKRFHDMKTHKPLACRDRSFEQYIICLNKK